jgi:tetrapyrrole methylase family protein/MazG family protein
VENPKIKSSTDSLSALIALIDSLRGEHGCPWDKKQTPRSMLVYLIEEMYELADAVESDTPLAVREELGDVLFHIFFMAKLFQETGHFSIYDVAQEITAKMIRRHPHVFSSAIVGSSDEVKQNWHKIKQDETAHRQRGSVLDSVPSKLPALMRAFQIFERTAGLGFDVGNISSLLTVLEKELAQLKLALNGNDNERISKGVGELLLSLIHVARFAKIHPETALYGAIKTFEKRFKLMEKRILEGGRDLNAVSPSEMIRIWKDTQKSVK